MKGQEKWQKMCLFGGRKKKLPRRWKQSMKETGPRRAFLGGRTINSVQNQRRTDTGKS